MLIKSNFQLPKHENMIKLFTLNLKFHVIFSKIIASNTSTVFKKVHSS